MALPAVRAHVVIDPAGILFLVMVCGFVPYAALKSRRRLGDRPLPFSRTRLFVQTIFVQFMAAHALYDAIAGVLMPRWYERETASAV